MKRSEFQKVCVIPPGASRRLASENGLGVIYAVHDSAGFHVERNGIPSGRTDYEIVSGLSISADSEHVGYTGAQNLSWDVIKDGAVVTGKDPKGSPYHGWDNVSKSTPALSPDGKHITFGCYSNGQWYANLDGQLLGDPFSGFSPGGIAFSPDSRHIGYAGALSGGWFAAVDRKRGPVYPTIGQRSWGFSPDSCRFAYVAAVRAEWVGDKLIGESSVIINDVPEQTWRMDDGSGLFEEIAFSPDSNRHAYWVTQSGKGFFVVDGRREPMAGGMVSGWAANPEWSKFPRTDRVESRAQPITFSPDSRHYVYAVSVNDECFIVRDGEAVISHWRICNLPIVYSADSEHFAYVAESRFGGSQSVWLDGVEMLGRHLGMAPIPPAFSPSSDRLAYVATSTSAYQICINGDSHSLFGTPPYGAGPVWISNNHVQIMSESNLELAIETFEATKDTGTS